MDPSTVSSDLSSAAHAAHAGHVDPYYAVIVIAFLGTIFVSRYALARREARKWVAKNWHTPGQSVSPEDVADE